MSDRTMSRIRIVLTLIILSKLRFDRIPGERQDVSPPISAWKVWRSEFVNARRGGVGSGDLRRSARLKTFFQNS